MLKQVQYDEVMLNNKKEKLNIVCLSNQKWDYPFPTNKKHVMSRMAELGHNIIFVDPPFTLGRSFLRQIIKGEWGIKRLLTNTYNEEGTLVYSPIVKVPDENVFSKAHARKINKLAKKNFDSARKTVLWIYNVELKGLQNYIDGIEHELLIYDCVDNYEAFPDRGLVYSMTVSKERLKVQEKKLTQDADLVFATAPGLVEKLREYRDEVHFTPNVGDYEKFKDTKNIKDIPQDLAQIPGPRIGFVGAVDDYKLDMELVKKAASDNPRFNFVIIGPNALKDREAGSSEIGTEGFENIYFLGSRPYEVIEKYYAGFDAYMIPYQLNDYTVGGCFPVKFHDALAAGLPTVVTDLPAYRPFANVSYISRNYEEFSENIKLAVRNDSPEKIEARQQVAKENNWDGKVEKLLNLIGGKL